jgi:hypothetical protein
MADPMQLVALDSDPYWWIWFFRTKDFSERQPTQIAMLVVDTPAILKFWAFWRPVGNTIDFLYTKMSCNSSLRVFWQLFSIHLIHEK